MKRFLLCFFVFGIVLDVYPEDIKLKCWIVSGNRDDADWTAQSVSNHIDGVNQIYSQVCMKFTIYSISSTNDAYLANVNLTNSVQWRTLTSIEQNTGMLELYFVSELEGKATAFYTSHGIVIGPDANTRTIAHEIGHACGLPDIYNEDSETSLKVLGMPSKERIPDDWGWYPPSMKQADLVRRLLMYGVYSDTKADITYGDIYGLYYTNFWNQTTRKWERVWQLNNVPIGFGRHGNRNPTSY
jgi:hypothetical protein